MQCVFKLEILHPTHGIMAEKRKFCVEIKGWFPVTLYFWAPGEFLLAQEPRVVLLCSIHMAFPSEEIPKGWQVICRHVHQSPLLAGATLSLIFQQDRRWT